LVYEDIDARGLEFFPDCGVAQGLVIIARNTEDACRGFKTPNQFGEWHDLGGEFTLLLIAEKVTGDEKASANDAIPTRTIRIVALLKRESPFFRYQKRALKSRISTEKRLKDHATIFNLSTVVITRIYAMLFL